MVTRNQGTALITGASSGIGAAFARKLAARRYNLVLVARRKEKLDDLATALQQHYPVTAEVLVADLAQPSDIVKVEQHIAEIPDLTMLVNNAGFGIPAMLAESAIDKQMDMINVHITATLRLTRSALPIMIKHRRGAIINVSSISAFLPMPGSANYSASKVYGVNLAKGLQTELIGTGVKVQALCPGFTPTGFHYTAEYKGFDNSDIPKIMWISSDAVVAASLRALQRNQTVCIPGLMNRLLVAIGGNSLLAPLMVAAVRRKRQ